MVISVIIPSYNRAPLLEQTLEYLRVQSLPDGVDMEVVVVDDGSSDDSAVVIERNKCLFRRFVHRYRERDEASCRSRARNLGIESATGQMLLFLDSGVLVPPPFVGRVCQMAMERPNTVLIHRVAGLFVERPLSGLLDFAALSPSSLEETVRTLSETPAEWGGWGDPRDPLMFSVDGEIDRLAAPWTLAWTAALSVPADKARQVGGFDESFLRWGAEDIDFAYRLYLAHVQFHMDEFVMGLHLPHSSEASDSEKAESHRVNVRRMHARYNTFDTEVFSCCTSPYVNDLLVRLARSHGRPWLERPELAECISTLVRTRSGVVLGSDVEEFLRRIPSTHIFWLNPLGCRRLQRIFPDRTVEHRLGSSTEYPEGFFSWGLVLDCYRAFGTRIMVPVLEELARIAEVVYMCFSDDAVPTISDSGEIFVSLLELESALGQRNMQLSEETRFGSHRIFRVKPSDLSHPQSPMVCPGD